MKLAAIGHLFHLFLQLIIN